MREIYEDSRLIYKCYVHGSVQRESMSIIVQRDATLYSFIVFLQTALHVSDGTLIHPLTLRGRNSGVPTPPGQRTVASTVRPVPDVVITV